MVSSVCLHYTTNAEIWIFNQFVDKSTISWETMLFVPEFLLRPLMWIIEMSKRHADCMVRGRSRPSAIVVYHWPTNPLAVPVLQKFVVTPSSKMTFDWRAQARTMIQTNKAFSEIAHLVPSNGIIVQLSIIGLSEIAWFECVFCRKTRHWSSSLSLRTRDGAPNKRLL